MGKSLLGKLAPAAVGMMELPRLPAAVLEGFRALGDLTGTTSDALDGCGIAGPASRCARAIWCWPASAGSVSSRSEEQRLSKLAAGTPLADWLRK